MNIDSLHEQLTLGFKRGNKDYEPWVTNNILACCLITAKILLQDNNRKYIQFWFELTSADNIKAKLQQLLFATEDQYCPHLFRHGYNLAQALAEIDEGELRDIIAYTNENFANSTKDVQELANYLNCGILSNEVDDLIKLLIVDYSQLELFVYGARTINYISDIRFSRFLSYYLDKYRWRESLTSKLLLQRADLIYLDTPTYKADEENRFDYGILSGNQAISIEEWQHLSNKYSYQQNIPYFSRLVEWCGKNHFTEPPDFSFFTYQIPNTDIYYSDIINCLAKIKPAGKLFFTIRSKTWQSEQLYLLRKFLTINKLIKQIIFIKTNRLNPWILIVLTPSPGTHDRIYMLNEKFYSDQGLKYVYNDKLNSRLANLINNEKIIPKTAGFVNFELIGHLQYNLDPNACLNFDDSAAIHIDTNCQVLDDLCISIFRGPSLSNKELSRTEITIGYYMIGHSAISDDGFKPENLTPIPEDSYNLHQKNYAVYPGDLVTLSRATTNRLVIIPQTAPKCIANINIIVIRPNTRFINPTYLYLALSSNSGKALFSSLEKGTALKSISIKELKLLPIKVIAMKKQHQIEIKYLRAKTKFLTALDEFKKNLAACYSALEE